jgi:hypothetical protein
MKGVVVLILIISLIIAGCVNEESPESIARSAPEVQSFLDEHPNAVIKTIYLNKDYIEKNQDIITEQCGVELPISEYNRVSISQGDSQLIVYIDPDYQHSEIMYFCNIVSAAKPAVIPTQEKTPSIPATIEPTPTPVLKESQNYLIKIDDALFLPIGDREINLGDTIIWRNLEDFKRPHYLVNENGIWDGPQILPYSRSIAYTFNETGTYTFYLQDYGYRKMAVYVS